MVTTSLTPPTLRIQQLYTPSPVSGTRRLLPYIIGPLAHAIRYEIPTERPNGFFGTYVNDVPLIEGAAKSLVPWVDLPLGNIVDLPSAKVFLEKASLRYLNHTAHDGRFLSRSEIRLPSRIFASGGGQVSNLIDAGVQPGDLVLVRGLTASSAAFTMACEVRGLKGDLVASSVSAVANATTNKGTSADAMTSSPALTNSTALMVMTLSGANYNVQKLGRLSDVYTVTVMLGGAAGVARVSIRSQSGLDDVADLVVSSFSTAVAFGNYGASLLLTGFSPGEELVAGDVWTITFTGNHAAPTLTVAGTYTGKTNRTYIVEVIEGDYQLAGGTSMVRVTSQDGTDFSLPVVVSSTNPIPLGSYGLTVAFTSSTGLMKGDKWLVTAVAETEGVVRTLVLSRSLPVDVMLNSTSANVEVELFKQVNVEIPRQGLSSGALNYTVEASQLVLRNDISLKLSQHTLSGVPITMPIRYVSQFTGSNQLYMAYRSWYPTQGGLIEIPSTANLDTVLDGPNDKANPLKHAVSACRLTAAGESIFAFVVGDPAETAGWTAAMAAALPYEAAYAAVPLTQVPALLNIIAAGVASSRTDDEIYRVGWFASPKFTGGPMLSAATRSDNSLPLAVVEDNPAASGDQFTLMRVTNLDVNFLQLGIRVGDEVRYNYGVDSWGVESYSSRKVTLVQSADSILVSPAFAEAESVPRRFEIHRTFNNAELRQKYSDNCSQWASDLIRSVVAPEVLYGGERLPGWYAAVLAAGLRASTVPQAILSTVKLPGLSQVYGLESFTTEDLNYIAGHGGFICIYDYKLAAVKIRHAITTGDNEIPAKLEESMVSALHVTLYELQKRLAPFAGQINLGDDDQFGVLAESIRGVLMAARAELIARDASVQFGGLIRDLVITDIRQSLLAADELIIEGELDLGNPGNRITFKLAIS